jgi:ferrous iron transport protein B
MVFVLLYLPCMSSLAVIKKETGSWKWTGFCVVYGLTVAYIAAFIVAHVGAFIIGGA